MLRPDLRRLLDLEEAETLAEARLAQAAADREHSSGL
jgi:hypothetical protein